VQPWNAPAGAPGSRERPPLHCRLSFSRGSMSTVDTSRFRNGLKVELDGEPFVMTYFQHVKPGKGGAFVRTKLKNLKTGRVLDRTFRSGETLDEAEVEDRKMQYLYQDGEQLVFMDTESYDQIPFSAEQVGDVRKFLKENLDVDVIFWRGKPINIELPAFIEAVITQTDPGIKGDTASGATKPATIETGAVVQVPLFIKEGERIRVDTRTGVYVERVG
jgi:elongation factor P